MQNLNDIGFIRVGQWHLSDSGLQLSLEYLADAAPALYAFVVHGEVMYVGKTKRNLKARLYGYLKGGGTQRTNIRVRGKILEALRDVDFVEILGFHNPIPQSLGQFTINLPAALEDDIIAKLDPVWNGGREPTAIQQSKDIPTLQEDVTKTLITPPILQERVNTTQEKNYSLMPSFLVTIGKTYFDQGFFNVPVDFERYFAADNSVIVIELPEASGNVTGKINRSANVNNTPRIMGGLELRDWIQSYVRLGKSIRVIVEDPKRIAIFPA